MSRKERMDGAWNRPEAEGIRQRFRRKKEQNMGFHELMECGGVQDRTQCCGLGDGEAILDMESEKRSRLVVMTGQR